MSIGMQEKCVNRSRQLNIKGYTVFMFRWEEIALLAIALTPLVWNPVIFADDLIIGERPAVEDHLDQSKIDSGAIHIKDIIQHGQLLFDARFNFLDGQGRPSRIISLVVQ